MIHDTESPSSQREFLRRCVQELNCTDPGFQVAQVYAILSLEEAVREMTAALARMADRLVAVLY
jgi:hypothetical protein